MKCKLCPRLCNSERTNTTNSNGYCKMPLLPRVARAALHYWEEPCISGKNGSGTVFFSGCSLGCVYCQNYELSHKDFGADITVERLSEIFRELENKGAHNINLVNPTHYALAIHEALKIYRPKIPIVYNSGGYDNVTTLKMLEDYIDIYLLDFKYLSNERAGLYSDAPDYPQTAMAAITECARQKKECIFDENGIMQSGLIVRHLLLPQATNEAINIFDWVQKNAPMAYFSLMSQYLPLGRAQEYKIINRRITKREYEKVVNHIIDNGFDNCYIQELESAVKDYIPEFDLTGLYETNTT